MECIVRRGSDVMNDIVNIIVSIITNISFNSLSIHS